MKAGVRISPRRIRITPVRAFPSVALMAKENLDEVIRRDLGANRTAHKDDRSAGFAHALKQGHGIDLEALDAPVGTDETEAVRRQAQRPCFTIRIVQTERDRRRRGAVLIHARRRN
jgi:hypothetical protein